MNFEVTLTLTTLGSGTPQYFVREALNGWHAQAKEQAISALNDLSAKRATRVLVEMMRLY